MFATSTSKFVYSLIIENIVNLFLFIYVFKQFPFSKILLFFPYCSSFLSVVLLNDFVFVFQRKADTHHLFLPRILISTECNFVPAYLEQYYTSWWSLCSLGTFDFLFSTFGQRKPDSSSIQFIWYQKFLECHNIPDPNSVRMTLCPICQAKFTTQK